MNTYSIVSLVVLVVILVLEMIYRERKLLGILMLLSLVALLFTLAFFESTGINKFILAGLVTGYSISRIEKSLK